MIKKVTLKRSTIIYDLPKEIVLNTHFSQVTGDVDLGELFKATKREDSYVFDHEDAVCKWLSFICGNYEPSISVKYPLHPKGYLKKLNHVLWVLPSVESCNAMAALLQIAVEAQTIRDYYTIVNCGDQSFTSSDKVLNAIGNVIEENQEDDKTLTLMNRINVKEVQCQYWSGVFLLRNFGSNGYIEFSQIAESVLMPWIEGSSVLKKEGLVFSFSSARALICINNSLRKEYHNRYFSEDVDSFKKFIRENLKVSPVDYWTPTEKETVNEDVIYEANPNESRSLWTSRRLINEVALGEFIKDKIHRKVLNVSGRKDSEKLEKAIKVIQGINSRLPAFLYLMDEKSEPLVNYLENSIELSSTSIIKKGIPRKKLSSADRANYELTDFEAITGVSPALFLEIVKSGVLKIDSIDRLACDFRAAEIVPFITSQYEKARAICPQSVGLVFNSMSWPDFKYQYREVDVWDQLLDNLCSPDKEDENSIRTITMLLCYLQLLRQSSGEEEKSFDIDAVSLKNQFLRVVSVKEDSDDIMSDFQRSDDYGLWVFPNESFVSVNDLYQEQIKDIGYLEHLIIDVRRRTEKMIEHYNSSHSFNRYQRASEPYYSDDKTILVNVPQGEEELVVEDGTVVIGRNAFLNCSNLKRVILPKTVQIIEEGAFHGCEKLDLIEFADSGSANWLNAFDQQIKKVALNSFAGSGIATIHKGFCDKQYIEKPFYYQEAPATNSVKVWCVDESGQYMDSTGKKRIISTDEGLILQCICKPDDFKKNEEALKATVKKFLWECQSHSELFYDIAPIYLEGTEKEKNERLCQIAFLFCANKNINAMQMGNLRFEEEIYRLIGKVMDEKVSKSSVGGTIYLSFDINAAELNNQVFADFLKVYYSEKNNVKADLVNFCRKENIGMTFYPNTGVFIDDDEEVPEKRMKVEENSYTIKIIYVSSSKLDAIAEELCKTYYQKSVLVEDEINNRAYFKKHPLVQPNMDTLKQDNIVLYEAFEEYKMKYRKGNTIQ